MSSTIVGAVVGIVGPVEGAPRNIPLTRRLNAWSWLDQYRLPHDPGRNPTSLSRTIDPLGMPLKLLGPEIDRAQVAGGVAFGLVVEVP